MAAADDKDTMLGIIESNNPGGMVTEGKFGALGNIKNIFAVIKKSWNDTVSGAHRSLLLGVREDPRGDSLYANASFPIGSIFLKDNISSSSKLPVGGTALIKINSTDIGEFLTDRRAYYIAGQQSMSDADFTQSSILLNKRYKMTPTAERAFNCVATSSILSTYPNATAYTSFQFSIVNLASATHAIVVALGTGMTNYGRTSDLTVAAATTALFEVTITSVTSATSTLLRLS